MAPNVKVIVISSVSGGGKTTLIHEILKSHPNFEVAITSTSRAPRGKEEDGKHYYFLSPEEFEQSIQKDEFLEHAQVHGNFYGVPKKPVLDAIDSGKSVILNIDMQGMRSVKEKLGELVFTIFVLPPDLEQWEDRLRNRKTETEEQIRARLQQGALELEAAFEYDHRIINDELDKAVSDLEGILKKEGVV